MSMRLSLVLPALAAIVLSQAATALAADVPKPLQGRFLAEDIGGGGVVDRLQTTLEFSADGRFFGHGGCNRYTGTVKAVGRGKLVFGPAASTRMACPPASMDQEAKFFKALDTVRFYAWDAKRRKLTLLDARKAPVVVLSRNDKARR